MLSRLYISIGESPPLHSMAWQIDCGRTTITNHQKFNENECCYFGSGDSNIPKRFKFSRTEIWNVGSLTCHHQVLGYHSSRRSRMSGPMVRSSGCMRVLVRHGSMRHDSRHRDSSCVARLGLLELYHATMHCHRLESLFSIENRVTCATGMEMTKKRR